MINLSQGQQAKAEYFRKEYLASLVDFCKREKSGKPVPSYRADIVAEKLYHYACAVATFGDVGPASEAWRLDAPKGTVEELNEVLKAIDYLGRSASWDIKEHAWNIARAECGVEEVDYS